MRTTEYAANVLDVIARSIRDDMPPQQIQSAIEETAASIRQDMKPDNIGGLYKRFKIELDIAKEQA